MRVTKSQNNSYVSIYILHSLSRTDEPWQQKLHHRRELLTLVETQKHINCISSGTDDNTTKLIAGHPWELRMRDHSTMSYFVRNGCRRRTVRQSNHQRNVSRSRIVGKTEVIKVASRNKNRLVYPSLLTGDG
jgi:hypothetical protein